VHYGLTGVVEGGDPPARWVVMGDHPFGGDVGYGPARALTAAQVAEVAAYLEQLDDATFRAGLQQRATLVDANIYLAGAVSEAGWGELVDEWSAALHAPAGALRGSTRGRVWWGTRETSSYRALRVRQAGRGDALTAREQAIAGCGSTCHLG
jgi:hypothetical protein